MHFNNNPALVLMGLPGSGKSHLARAIAGAMEYGALICSADYYFTSQSWGDGPIYNQVMKRAWKFLDTRALKREEGCIETYDFDPKKLNAAHRSCLSGWLDFLTVPKTLICDNTNLTPMEAQPYMATALTCRPAVLIMCGGTTPADIKKANEHQKHSIPPEAYNHMVATRLLYQPPPWWLVRTASDVCDVMGTAKEPLSGKALYEALVGGGK